MFDSVFGLPTHPLIVHATVVVVPAAAISVLVATTWPRFRAWAGWLPAALSVFALILAPLSTSTGEGLEHVVGGSALVEEHAELGEMLVWWVLPLALFAATSWALNGRTIKGRATWLPRLLQAGAVVAALGTLVLVALIGHSGAKAAWSDVSTDGGQSTNISSWPR